MSDILECKEIINENSNWLKIIKIKEKITLEIIIKLKEIFSRNGILET